MGDSKLGKGTAVVALSGVAFDLWVSLFMADPPPEHIVRVVTAVFVVILLYGLWLMWRGYQTDKQNEGMA
jgi:4-amino-4-deoxy-L-arabinose transferase-like glycosyltransferase